MNFYNCIKFAKTLPGQIFSHRSYTKIVITDNGSTIVALHPKVKFPYECSRPLPPPPMESDGILRMENKTEINEAFSKLHPTFARKELQRITLTTKHGWFPRARDRKAKKTPMHRKYL